MRLPIYQIDAFADSIFQGNPAAVCPLENWLSDDLLQKIAEENNLSETVYFVKENDGYHIRWFTPVTEVDLCGHATLASAYVIFTIFGHESDQISFNSKSGPLTVFRRDDSLVMDFPVTPLEICETPPEIVESFGKAPLEVFRSDDYMAVYENEEDIRLLSPDFAILERLECRGVIATSTGESSDFVSRFFAPRCGINEDPVTGSAHCALTPYWSRKLGKTKLSARQLSKRGGDIQCQLIGDRVLLSGKAAKYLEGTIEISM
ncbi:MAG: PhzF family phenazine biosynthesis protein [Opitutaceae bacterium]|nr:PhzF family phenazine biosynthesis protein [Opitutaceae bacterium]